MSHVTDEGNTLAVLTAEECWRLVCTQHVGRLVWDGSHGLTAVPVNYAVVDGVVVMRTTAYSAITRECDDSIVAFEVDSYDPFTRTGWSVLLRGRAGLRLAHPGEQDTGAQAWPSGPRPVHVQLDAQRVTGRRLLPHT